jgi:hypothetical protein
MSSWVSPLRPQSHPEQTNHRHCLLEGNLVLSLSAVEAQCLFLPRHA